METNNQPSTPPPQTETTNVRNILDTNSTQELSPQPATTTTNENVEAEDSYNAQEQQRETPIEGNNEFVETATETKSETSNIQLPQAEKEQEKEEVSIANDREEPMDISNEGNDDEDGSNDQVNDDVDKKEQQMEPLLPQPQTQQIVEDQKPHNEKLHVILTKDNDDQEEEGSILNKAKSRKYQDNDEDELLKSDDENNEDDAEKEIDHKQMEKDRGTEVLDNISMEQENELLKSEDDEEEEQDKNDIKKKENLENKEEENTEDDIHDNKLKETKEIPMEIDENSNESKVEFKNQQLEEVSTTFAEEINSDQDNTSIQNEDKSREDTTNRSDVVEKLKDTKNSENHRILYKFDLDDDDSQESFKINKSFDKIDIDGSLTNQNQESITQQSISETTDIKDIQNEEKIKENKEELLSNDSHPSVSEANSKEDEILENISQEQQEIKGDDHNLEDNSAKINNQWNSSNKFSQNDDVADEEESSLHSPKLNGDHYSPELDNEQQNEVDNSPELDNEQQNEIDNTNESNISNDEDVNNLSSSSKTSIDSPSTSSKHSLFSLPQNEEARTEFHCETNEELETSHCEDNKSLNDSENNDSNLKINEAQQQSNQEDDSFEAQKDNEASRSSLASLTESQRSNDRDDNKSIFSVPSASFTPLQTNSPEQMEEENSNSATENQHQIPNAVEDNYEPLFPPRSFTSPRQPQQMDVEEHNSSIKEHNPSIEDQLSAMEEHNSAIKEHNTSIEDQLSAMEGHNSLEDHNSSMEEHNSAMEEPNSSIEHNSSIKDNHSFMEYQHSSMEEQDQGPNDVEANNEPSFLLQPPPPPRSFTPPINSLQTEDEASNSSMEEQHRLSKDIEDKNEASFSLRPTPSAQSFTPPLNFSQIEDEESHASFMENPEQSPKKFPPNPSQMEDEGSHSSSMGNTQQSPNNVKDNIDEPSFTRQPSGSYIFPPNPQQMEDEASHSSSNENQHQSLNDSKENEPTLRSNPPQLEEEASHASTEEYNHQQSPKPPENKNEPTFILRPPLPSPNPPQIPEEEVSRSSVASSGSYASTTSSSQHLVIDHPMDDVAVKEEKVKPLKISLKRKLSYGSDNNDANSMEPKQKQVHLYKEPQERDEDHFNPISSTQKHIEYEQSGGGDNFQIESRKIMQQNCVRDQIQYQIKAMEEYNVGALNLVNKEQQMFPIPPEADAIKATSFKSLLLQQLEKPLASINLPATQISAAGLLMQPPLSSFVSNLIQAPPPPPPASHENQFSSELIQSPYDANPIHPPQQLTLQETQAAAAQLMQPTYNSSLIAAPPPPPPQETQIIPAFQMQPTLPYIPNQLAVGIQLTPPPPPPPPLPLPPAVTKYLCFKCKTGSFDSFTALTEHQKLCLASHNLFPFLPSTIISQPPPPPPPPLPVSIPPPASTSSTADSRVSSKPLSPKKAAAPLMETKDITPTAPIAPSLTVATITTPAATTTPMITTPKKRYYKCSTCNTFHENWNLFLHIREQHNRHMCLYCVRFFPSAEKLALHLEIKHDLEQNHFNSEEALRKSIPQMEGYALESRFLICCTCQHVFVENEQFSQHDCAEYIKPCALCGQKGRHTNQCKAHPDSKRFSKLKKKKDKTPQKAVAMSAGSNKRSKTDSPIVPPITISNHNINPTIISNSNLNCDSGRRDDNNPRPPTINAAGAAAHSEDSNSSSNMVIDESCNTSHLPPPPVSHSNDVNRRRQQQATSVQLEPDLPPDRSDQVMDLAIKIPLVPPLKLVVPKLKLCVPKQFQKSVDDALSTSDSDEIEDEGGDAEGEREDVDKTNNDDAYNNSGPTTSAEAASAITPIDSSLETNRQALLAENTPANSQDMDLERNSATESATEAGNSQDADAAYDSDANGDNNGSDKSKLQNRALSLDDDDSLDEPNSNLVRIMQEIERTKMDIQRTKKTSFRHNKQFALPRQPTISQSSNRTADHNWSPTPPASPNSRWFTPRRLTMSQSGGEDQVPQQPPPPAAQQPQLQPQPPFLLPPPSPVKQWGKTLERRDTIGSDVMDIDESITSQPTQTIYRSESQSLDNDNLNTSTESIDEKSFNNEPMDTSQISQITDNETSISDLNHSTEIENNNNTTPPQAEEMEGQRQEYQERENKMDVDEEEKMHSQEENKMELEEDEKDNKEEDKEDDKEEDKFVENPQNTDLHLTQSSENESKEISNELMEEAKDQDLAEEDDNEEIDVCDNKEQLEHKEKEQQEEIVKLPPADGIEIANEDCVTVDLQLDRAIDKYEIIDFVRICLKAVYPLCLYCNHARRIAVNGRSLIIHFIGHHRFTATVDSITAEELLPDTIVNKLKSFLPEMEEHYLNSTSYCTFGNGAFTKHFNERIFECFQCRFVTSTHKELYLHNRKMHLRTAILCFMCRANFFSFSEILCHICPGVANKVSVFDVKFRCCLCELDNIPSPFRLMVHLRKKHFACDVCLEDCRDQSKLSSHVWKHKLHHLCYRCGIAYRNKLDITKHLFWKHGTESTICKRCLQKRWRHVYHFCIPPQTFVCEVCNLCFSKAMYLRVHKRLHSGDLRYPCIEDNCEEKFVSRKLLLKHEIVHLTPPTPPPAQGKEEDLEKDLENKENISGESKEKEMLKTNANDVIKPEIIEIKKEPLDEAEMMEAQKSLKLEKPEKIEKKVNEKSEKDSKTNALKKDASVPRKKRKKSKRSKELLEDLNLIAPNLSESDSSDDDDEDSDADSKTKSEIDAMPRVMLSPPSEAENEDNKDNAAAGAEVQEPQQVLEIWKNFLKTQQESSNAEAKVEEAKVEEQLPKPKPKHVAESDHDYCKMEEPPKPEVATTKDASNKKPLAEVISTPETSPLKRKQSKSPRRNSSKRSDNSSSSSGSSSSSDSSCSCGSNCSCSSSGSDSSSSSSSSEDSESSQASNNSVRKRHRKKSERDRLRKRSESNSPLKQHKLSVSISAEVINVDDDEANNANNVDEARPPSPPKEPLIYESDLETNESETDEEFYDEHPQKLANELLAQKRAQLMAQTRLSPSHNYDIVENSRPSTPSLPEEVASNEKPKIKVKKKKRDRKSSCKGGLHSNHNQAQEGHQHNAPAQVSTEAQHNQENTAIMPGGQATTINTTVSLINPVIDSQLSQAPILYTMPQNLAPQSIYAPPPQPQHNLNEQTLTPRPLTMPPYGGGTHRMSEGSSCSDADGSLKRSKRQRRPNKFYGYTSDDEHLLNGPPLMIGTRAFKPQPPPQLTWHKEDLPTPSKSIINSKNKTPRTPKTPANTTISAATATNSFNTSFSTSSSSRKRSRLSLVSGEKSARKRSSAKKKESKTENKFPPIPTLKIRPSQIGLSTTTSTTSSKAAALNHSTSAGIYNTTESSSDEDTNNYHAASTSYNAAIIAPPPPSQQPPAQPAIINPLQTLLPQAPLPTPQTTAFNHKIPPALLPNPDFATLQYFKANNIRYPIRPPAGARHPREGESVYCYCRCPYDEVSEMIACDGENCLIEWFHFECVGIMVAPQGKWFCAECRPKYSEELYPTTAAAGQHSHV